MIVVVIIVAAYLLTVLVLTGVIALLARNVSDRVLNRDERPDLRVIRGGRR